MAVMLEDYGAVRVMNTQMDSYTFIIPLDGARDVTLADLATELNVYRDLMIYRGEKYYALTGVSKRMDPVDASWSATIESRKI